MTGIATAPRLGGKVMLYLEGRNGSGLRRWALTVGTFTIGNGPECEIVVEDWLLSNRHLQITVELDGAWVRDQDSENGLWVNGERVSAARVTVGHSFAAGETYFTIREGVTQVSGPANQPEATQIDASQITPVRRMQAGGSDLLAVEDPQNTGESPQPPWIKSVARALERGAATHDQLLHSLLAAIAQTSGAGSAAVLREAPNGIVLDALYGPPLRGSLKLDVRTLRLEFLRFYGCLREPGRDWRLSVIEGTAADGASYWLVVCPAPYAPLTSSSTLMLLAAWAFREAAQLPRVGSVRHDDRSATASVPPHTALPPYVAVAASSQALLETIELAAPSELSVLIEGESGAGKEQIARRIHAYSARMDGPFVAVDCASIPAELLEAELFGIEHDGASGESPRTGRLAQAHGGTLFLEAIGDLLPDLQPKLLSAITSRQITPLGAPAPIQIDLRLISTNLDCLRESAASGRFLLELYYRLAAITLDVLPLRERPEEIVPLARQFAVRAARDCNRPFFGIDLEAARLLLKYAWPGNVRELKQVIESAVASSHGPTLRARALPPEITGSEDP